MIIQTLLDAHYYKHKFSCICKYSEMDEFHSIIFGRFKSKSCEKYQENYTVFKLENLWTDIQNYKQINHILMI